LVIGAYHFTTRSEETFIEANNSHDVLAGLSLMSSLLLENYNKRGHFSRITDTLMNQIKESSTPSSNHQPINSNSFGRVIKTFACFVIDFLAVQLVFNNWFPFKCQNAPSPYACNIEPKAEMDAIQTNQKILILLVLHMNLRAHSLLLDQGHSGWPSPNLKKVFSTAQNYKVKFDKGIISSWEGYHLDKFNVCLSMCIFPYLTLNLLPNPCNPRNVCGSTIGWYYNSFTPIFTFQLAWTLPPIQNITSSMVIGISLFVQLMKR
jgi:hypothetical protein